MTTKVRQLLESFDRLPEPEKREAATEILRRSLELDSPVVDDHALVENAEALFLQLDKQEAADGSA
jgi:hypothetical protein